MDGIKKVKITTEYITIGQFLKFVSIIDNGAEAKFFLQENEVLIDGEPDNRRGRKLRGGEVVEVLGRRFEVTR